MAHGFMFKGLVTGTLCMLQTDTMDTPGIKKGHQGGPGQVSVFDVFRVRLCLPRSSYKCNQY